MISNHEIIKKVCDTLTDGSIAQAREIIQNQYPFTPLIRNGRQYSNYQKTKVFLKDGFTDRYSGEKMVFPPVLRLLSNLMPTEFPFHNNWKMSECHFAYWQLLPTIDHVVPVTRGGEDNESNWVCTSQLRNSIKSNWVLEELGWKLHEPGDLKEWDGLLNWFMLYVDAHPEVMEDKYIHSWHSAAKRAIKEFA
jgi:5-methylcytosine-specific restriction endonuclease McrA